MNFQTRISVFSPCYLFWTGFYLISIQSLLGSAISQPHDYAEHLSTISLSLEKDGLNQDSIHLKLDKYIELPTSVRALEVVSDQVIWFAGSEGYYGYTINGGMSWDISQLHYENKLPHFRAIAHTSSHIYLLSIGSPGLLFRSSDHGDTWQMVYKDDHPDAFYDAMTFWDDTDGIAMGDPTDGCLSIILTHDGGETWSKASCDALPASDPGEAAFAASNTNISVYGNHAWIASGGARARIFHTKDRGTSWEVWNTPIQEGGQMTGIFTIDFWNDKTGIAFGGDWNDQQDNFNNKALSIDGGRTWKSLTNGKGPGYRSCVQFAPGSDAKEILAVGIPGISISTDRGKSWQTVSNESYYTARYGQEKSHAWMAGSGKLVRYRIVHP